MEFTSRRINRYNEGSAKCYWAKYEYRGLRVFKKRQKKKQGLDTMKIARLQREYE